MNNLLSYCGLVDAKIRASEKDLPVKDSILDFAGNASSASTSGQLSETMFSGEIHQITGYLFSDHNFASKRLKQISTGQKSFRKKNPLFDNILVSKSLIFNFSFYCFSKQFIFKLKLV